MSSAAIVTKDWLAAKVAANPGRAIGRALAAVYAEQTDSERRNTATKLQNGRGFSKPDARVGSIGARMYAAHGKLPEWQTAHWSKHDKSGYPRICKYVAQLDVIAARSFVSCSCCAGRGFLYSDIYLHCLNCDGAGFVAKRVALPSYSVDHAMDAAKYACINRLPTSTVNHPEKRLTRADMPWLNEQHSETQHGETLNND